jgi:hypothetical protein
MSRDILFVWNWLLIPSCKGLFIPAKVTYPAALQRGLLTLRGFKKDRNGGKKYVEISGGSRVSSTGLLSSVFL